MRFAFLTLAALMASASGIAAGTGPEIGYSKSSPKGDSIYLVDPDGTAQTKLYQAPGTRGAPGQISELALRPGGGEAAFVQDFGKLLILSYDDRGQAVGTPVRITVGDHSPPCAITDIDYRSDGTLLISACNAAYIRAPGESTATFLFAANDLIALRWMRDGSILFDDSEGTGRVLKRRASNGTITTVGPHSYFNLHIGMARGSDRAAISDTASFKVIDLTTGSTADGCKSAGQVNFSPADTEILYRSSGSTTQSSILFVQKADCSGQPFRLAIKGGYRAITWRAD